MSTIARKLAVGGGILLSIAMTGCFGSGEATDQLSRAAAVEEVLAISPPAAVTNIQSSWSYLRDSYVKWVRIECDRTSLSNLLSGIDLAKPTTYIAGERPGQSNGNSDVPDWWSKAKISGSLEEYMRVLPKPPSESSLQESIYMWVNRETGVVYAKRNAWH